jgi:hypothetical protein
MPGGEGKHPPVGRPPIPSGTAPTPERQPAPHGHGVRNLLIAGGATIASGAAIAAGFLGLDKLRSSDESSNTNPSNGVATQVISTETASPTEIPATPTPEPKTLESQLPYELAHNSMVDYQGKDVKFSFGVDKNVQTRTECMLANGSMRECAGLEKFFLSDKYTRQEFNETRTNEELLGGVNDAFVEFFALNIKEKVPEYKDASLDEIKTLIRDKKAPLSPLPGYVGKSNEITTIMIDPAKGVRVYEINEKGHFSPTTGFSYNYRLLEDGSFVMEMYSAPAEQAGAIRVATAPTFHPEAFSITSTMAGGLAQATYLKADGPGPLGSQLLTRKAQIENHMMKKNGDTWAGYIEVVPHQDNQTK